VQDRITSIVSSFTTGECSDFCSHLAIYSGISMRIHANQTGTMMLKQKTDECGVADMGITC